MKSDNWIAVSELGEEIVRLVNCNSYKHLSATERAKHSAVLGLPSM